MHQPSWFSDWNSKQFRSGGCGFCKRRGRPDDYCQMVKLTDFDLSFIFSKTSHQNGRGARQYSTELYPSRYSHYCLLIKAIAEVYLAHNMLLHSSYQTLTCMHKQEQDILLALSPTKQSRAYFHSNQYCTCTLIPHLLGFTSYTVYVMFKREPYIDPVLSSYLL